MRKTLTGYTKFLLCSKEYFIFEIQRKHTTMYSFYTSLETALHNYAIDNEPTFEEFEGVESLIIQGNDTYYEGKLACLLIELSVFRTRVRKVYYAEIYTVNVGVKK
jgi:hypothetical protein